MGRPQSDRRWPDDSRRRWLTLIAGGLALAAFWIAFAIGEATAAQSATTAGRLAAINVSSTPLKLVGIAPVQAPPGLKAKDKPTAVQRPKKRAGTAKPPVSHVASKTRHAGAGHKTKATSGSQTTTSAAFTIGTGTVSGGG